MSTSEMIEWLEDCAEYQLQEMSDEKGQVMFLDVAARLKKLEAVAEVAKELRQSQKDYMADRGNETKGTIVGQKATRLDAALEALDKEDEG